MLSTLFQNFQEERKKWDQVCICLLPPFRSRWRCTYILDSFSTNPCPWFVFLCYACPQMLWSNFYCALFLLTDKFLHITVKSDHINMRFYNLEQRSAKLQNGISFLNISFTRDCLRLINLNLLRLVKTHILPKWETGKARIKPINFIYWLDHFLQTLRVKSCTVEGI